MGIVSLPGVGPSLTVSSSHPPLSAADTGPRPLRGFSVLDVVASYILEGFDECHPSMSLPPAPHDPFRVSDAALRSDQVDFDESRTNQCLVGVAELQQEAQQIHHVAGT